MKINKCLYLLLFVIILSSSLIFLLDKGFYKEIERKTLGMDIIITDQINKYGVNIDTDALHFGKLSFGDSAKRTLNIKNDYDFDVLINFEKDKSALSEIVKISSSSFILKPQESIDVNIKGR